MSRPVDGELQGGQQGDDQGQGHGDDHGRGQEPNPFWSEEVREEHLLTQARPREVYRMRHRVRICWTLT